MPRSTMGYKSPADEIREMMQAQQLQERGVIAKKAHIDIEAAVRKRFKAKNQGKLARTVVNLSVSVETMRMLEELVKIMGISRGRVFDEIVQAAYFAVPEIRTELKKLAVRWDDDSLIPPDEDQA